MIMTVKENTQTRMTDALSLSRAIKELEEATDPVMIENALKLIPSCVYLNISAEFWGFILHDITREEFIDILKNEKINL